MIALDSNVLLRYLTEDDPAQTRQAVTLIEEQLTAEQPGYVSIVVLLETIWVLGSGYRYPAELIERVVSGLLDAAQLHFGERHAIETALAQTGPGLVDRIIHELGRQAGCRETVTFDRRFARLPGVRLL